MLDKLCLIGLFVALTSSEPLAQQGRSFIGKSIIGIFPNSETVLAVARIDSIEVLQAIDLNTLSVKANRPIHGLNCALCVDSNSALIFYKDATPAFWNFRTNSELTCPALKGLSTEVASTSLDGRTIYFASEKRAVFEGKNGAFIYAYDLVSKRLKRFPYTRDLRFLWAIAPRGIDTLLLGIAGFLEQTVLGSGKITKLLDANARSIQDYGDCGIAVTADNSKLIYSPTSGGIALYDFRTKKSDLIRDTEDYLFRYLAPSNAYMIVVTKGGGIYESLRFAK